jgi:hypothetical protein
MADGLSLVGPADNGIAPVETGKISDFIFLKDTAQTEQGPQPF